ncbi:MAG: hypothetical protein KIS92_13080 [Planctomycetota bacterium]|nr:hypothetical protein [Planctomycetota bacterium]
MKTWTMWMCAGLLAGGAAWGQDAAPAKESAPPAPQKVGEEAKELLDAKISLSVKDMGIGLAFAWVRKMTATSLPIDVSKAANERKITFQVEDAALAAVLRQITQQTGAVYRHVDGRIQIVTPEEKTALDAGKAVFVPWEDAPAPKPAETKADPAAHSDPAAKDKVGDEAALLLRKVSLEMIDTPLAEAMDFLGSFAKVKILVSKGAGAKTVTLKLHNATMGEAVRQIKDQAGAVHRVKDGVLRIATDEEWAAIDAGKGKFEAYGAK